MTRSVKDCHGPWGRGINGTVAGRTFAITAIAVAAGAMLVCASVAVSRAVDEPQSLAGGSFLACDIPPCAPGTAEPDKLGRMVRGLKSSGCHLRGRWIGKNVSRVEGLLYEDITVFF